MKRQRGRGRKPGGGNPGNRALESNGPEVKIRGTAAQIFEKYSQYARDAQSAGDRVKYENYLQHAEHYFRIMAATMPRDQMRSSGESGMPFSNQNNNDDRDIDDTIGADPLKVVDDGSDDDDGYDGDDADAREDEGVEAGGQPQGQGGQAQGGQGQGGQGQGGDDRDGGPNRPRRRRNRRRHHEAGGQGGQPNAERNNGGDQEARSALDALAAKQGALAGS